jgi:hypothetical protein
VDAVKAQWVPGFFRPLDHLVASDARSMEADGCLVFFAVCGSVTVAPGTPVSGRREQCLDCLAHLRDWEVRDSWTAWTSATRSTIG